MTYQHIKDAINKLTPEQLQQDAAISLVSEVTKVVEVIGSVEFTNPLIPEGPCFEDVEDSILDANHPYFSIMI